MPSFYKNGGFKFKKREFEHESKKFLAKKKAFEHEGKNFEPKKGRLNMKVKILS